LAFPRRIRRRGFIDAYDAGTGARKWRFYTVPVPGEAGHDTWKATPGRWWRTRMEYWNLRSGNDQIFWQPESGAFDRGAGRLGDNLYSNSLLALNTDTGKLSWYFQFTKHDEHDWMRPRFPF